MREYFHPALETITFNAASIIGLLTRLSII